jgi:hypothetical protein
MVDPLDRGWVHGRPPCHDRLDEDAAIASNPRHAGLDFTIGTNPASGWCQRPAAEIEIAKQEVKPRKPARSFFGANPRQFGLEQPQREEDREREANDACDVAERQETQLRHVLGYDEKKDEEQDGGHFGHADEHGLPFQQTARADASRCDNAGKTPAPHTLTQNPERFH